MQKDFNELIKQFQKHPKDMGSCEVQVILHTDHILSLTEHLKVHRKDKHSRRGITNIVSKRQRCLKYIKINDFDGYKRLIKALELRH